MLIKTTLPEVHTESVNPLARYLSPLNRSDSMYQALLIETLSDSMFESAIQLD